MRFNRIEWVIESNSNPKWNMRGYFNESDFISEKKPLEVSLLTAIRRKELGEEPPLDLIWKSREIIM